MRIGGWAAAAICAAVATAPARAQSAASTILGGASPASIKFKPIDMSTIVASISAAPPMNPTAEATVVPVCPHPSEAANAASLSTMATTEPAL